MLEIKLKQQLVSFIYFIPNFSTQNFYISFSYLKTYRKAQIGWKKILSLVFRISIIKDYFLRLFISRYYFFVRISRLPRARLYNFMSIHVNLVSITRTVNENPCVTTHNTLTPKIHGLDVLMENLY